MNANAEVFVRSADVSLLEPQLPVGIKPVFKQVRNYVELMAQQRKEVRSIPLFRSQYEAFLKAANNGKAEDARVSALTFKGIPLEASRNG